VLLISAAVFAANSYLSDREFTVNQLRDDVKGLKTRRTRLRKVQERLVTVEDWLEADIDWLEQMRFLSDALPPAREMYVVSLRCNPGTVLLTGRVKDREVARRFAAKLMAVPGYEVKTKGVYPVKDKSGYGQEFKIEILASPPTPAATKPADTGSNPAGTGNGKG